MDGCVYVEVSNCGGGGAGGFPWQWQRAVNYLGGLKRGRLTMREKGRNG